MLEGLVPNSGKFMLKKTGYRDGSETELPISCRWHAGGPGISVGSTELT